MKRKALDRFLKQMDECDSLRQCLIGGSPYFLSLSQGMKDAIEGMCIERYNRLNDQLKREGINLDEEA